MFRYISYRIYPSEKQRATIDGTLRCCDLVWNLALDYINNCERTKSKLPSERQMIAKIADWIEDYPILLNPNPYTLTSIISDFYKTLATKPDLQTGDDFRYVV